MPSLTVARKGIHTDGSDGNKGKRKEGRCFFGLLSLRGGIIVHSTLNLLLPPIVIGFTTTREELPTNGLPGILNIYIPIPFMDRGIASATFFSTTTSLIGLYGAYNRSYRAIKIYRMISYGELFNFFEDLASYIIPILKMLPFTATNERIIDLAEKSGKSVDSYMTCFKGFWMFCTPMLVALTTVEIRMLYIRHQYEEFLAPEKEE